VRAYPDTLPLSTPDPLRLRSGQALAPLVKARGVGMTPARLRLGVCRSSGFKTGVASLFEGKKAAPFLGPRFKRGKGLGWVSQKQCKAPLRQAKRLKERCRKQMEKSEGHWLVRPLLLMDSRCTCAAKRRDVPLRRAAESQLHAKYGSYAESNGSERAETAGPAGKGQCRILHIHCTPILPQERRKGFRA
jgi:hypothetical protein